MRDTQKIDCLQVMQEFHAIQDERTNENQTTIQCTSWNFLVDFTAFVDASQAMDVYMRFIYLIFSLDNSVTAKIITDMQVT